MNASVLKLWFQINFIILYHSQSLDKFENFVYNLDLTPVTLTKKNPFISIIIWDFNAEFSKWCSTDKTKPEEAKFDNLTLMWVGFSGVHFQVGEVKLTTPLPSLSKTR